MKAVTLIWAAYDVDVHRSNPDDVEQEGAVRLTVVIADRPDRHVAVEVLGSIEFIDDRPTPTIVLHPNAIARLASDAAKLRPGHPESSPGFRNLILGRALGRALAHEIGHFLLRSRQHSETGLMRAKQSVFRLIGRENDEFALSADEVMRLTSVTSSAVNGRAEAVGRDSAQPHAGRQPCPAR